MDPKNIPPKYIYNPVNKVYKNKNGSRSYYIKKNRDYNPDYVKFVQDFYKNNRYVQNKVRIAFGLDYRSSKKIIEWKSISKSQAT